MRAPVRSWLRERWEWSRVFVEERRVKTAAAEQGGPAGRQRRQPGRARRRHAHVGAVALFHCGYEAHDSPTNVGFSSSTTASAINPMVDIKSLKVTELKEELKKRGLVTTGLKKDVSAAQPMAECAQEHQPYL